jgi:hypothetical protein
VLRLDAGASGARAHMDVAAAFAAPHANGLARDLLVGDLVLRPAALAIETHVTDGRSALEW